MRSGTSFFNQTVFKKTIQRFWPIGLIYLVRWLISLPLSGLVLLRMDANAFVPGIDGGYMEDFALRQVPASVAGSNMIFYVIFGAVVAMAVFSHLYNPRSANLFGSLPIRREGMFLTHYLAGLSFFLVPNVVIFLLTLLVEAAGGMVSWTGLLFWLAVACGEAFFFYTMAVFCAMFAGHILALPAFYGIANVLVMGLVNLVEMVFQLFFYGFTGFPVAVGTVTEWFTPVWRLYEAVDIWTYYKPREGTETLNGIYAQRALNIEGLETVAVYAVVAVVLAVCAFFLYRARRLESAGDVVAVRWMRPVFKYGMAFCTGLAFGMATMAIIFGGEIVLMIAIVVWGIIGYFAAEMLLQKSFKVFKKWKGAAAVTAVFVILFCVVSFDLTGFETRVPAPADVESVKVSNLETMFLNDSGDRFDGMTITDPEAIRLIILLHQAAVEQRGTDHWSGTAATNTGLSVTYRLKNGATLSRRYSTVWLQLDEVEKEGTAAWAVQQLYNNRDLCWQMYGFDALEDYLARGGRLGEVQYERWDDKEGWAGDYFYGDEPKILLAAVKEDFFAGRIGARQVTQDWWDKYDRENHETLTFTTAAQEGVNYQSFYITITLSDTATSTRGALEELTPKAESDWPDTPYSTVSSKLVLD